MSLPPHYHPLFNELLNALEKLLKYWAGAMTNEERCLYLSQFASSTPASFNVLINVKGSMVSEQALTEVQAMLAEYLGRAER